MKSSIFAIKFEQILLKNRHENNNLTSKIIRFCKSDSMVCEFYSLKFQHNFNATLNGNFRKCSSLAVASGITICVFAGFFFVTHLKKSTHTIFLWWLKTVTFCVLHALNNVSDNKKRNSFTMHFNLLLHDHCIGQGVYGTLLSWLTHWLFCVALLPSFLPFIPSLCPKEKKHWIRENECERKSGVPVFRSFA